jgi:hypothetical protein
MVKILVGVMFWPAIWAGALMIVALTRDVFRQTKRRPSSEWRTAA